MEQRHPRARALILLAVAVLTSSAVDQASGKTGSKATSQRVTQKAAAPATPPPTPAATAAAPTAPPTALVRALGAELGGSSSCMIVRSGGRTVAEYNPDGAVTPASTQKVLVAAAALETLGADHRFTTSLHTLVEPKAGIAGDMWLVGGGDPYLATPEYAAYLRSAPRWREVRPTPLGALADQVVAAGIKEIRGRIRTDDSRHDSERLLGSWKAAHLTGGNISLLSALTVNEGWAPFFPRTAVANPAKHAGDELTRLLLERGVNVTAPAEHGAAPEGAKKIAEVASAPLPDLLTGMLSASDNVAAEMIAREIGLKRTGAGTTPGGAAAVSGALADAGIPHDGVALADGSGLDRGNRATCRSLIGALEAAPAGVDLGERLAIAGHTGTLNQRYVSTPLHGTLKAKTGYIGGVVGLTGNLNLGRPVTFALVQNGVGLTDGRAREGRILTYLAEWSAGRFGD